MGMRPAARMPKLTRRSRVLITIALAAVVLLLFGPRFIDTYVNWLWFGELGFRSVFTTVVVTRLVIFLVVTAVVAAIAVSCSALVATPSASAGLAALLRYRTSVMSRLRLVAIGIPAAVGVLAGLVAQGYWVQVQLFLHGGDFGVTDPQFGRDLGFYAFDLPFYRLALTVVFVAVFLALLANVVAHYIFGGIRLTGRQGVLSKSARIQLVVLVGVLVLMKVFAYWLDGEASRSPGRATPTSTRCCRPS